MTKTAPKAANAKKTMTEAERARRRQNFFFIAMSVLIVLSMLLSLVKLV